MNVVEKIQESLKQEIANAVLKAGLAAREQLPEVILETPKDKSHGDYSTNMAMQLARVAKKAPRQIAEEIKDHFDGTKASIKKIDIAGPGFINFYMDNSYLTDLVPAILEQGDQYGRSNAGKREKIQVEFVSANPTGDLHLGHARGAAVGDSLCNILDMAGYDVSREYYINDAGNQVHNLALSVEARYFQALGMDKAMPEDGYHGQDVIEIGKELAERYGDEFVHKSEEERIGFFRKYGLDFELKKLKDVLEQFRVTFDVWYSETSLYESGKIKDTLELLEEKGHLYTKDGATWFRSTDFGDDKDRVLIKKDGTYTYITPDIAYHLDKLNRGFDKLINIWGADHHGYIPRMKAAIEALGFDPGRLEVEIIQLVHLYRNGERVKMSKRSGKSVTMSDLIEEVGLDAVRYFFAMRSADTHMDFDLDLAVAESNDNPVFYAQYAHARICSILRSAEEKGLSIESDIDFSNLKSEKAVELLKKLGEFPQEVAEAAAKRIPHRITNYIFDLASAFHSYYNAEKVLNEDKPEETKARLALVKAVQITMKNSLTLVGVAAPEKM
ncbi:arginine--tRNA ligase [Siminovitchia sp. FSL H7-0308]|uniref:Arginine--tRNA ligase n=1 Tax=Siminovitchia thermophila TaxID=1245522 RepID=A0ABS2R4B9_9BACI|nr:arginine--tRNA ligase [Siminovitchia thermophila]MBM7714449.1 arginyl-tRNA synthetase [Siminovitchia thermophila]ONK25011.1 arginine--tRNA ligase [Bacillus sp. VT-16-64]